MARQNLNRNWQNGKLWWNDPDAVTLSGTMPDEQYRFHSTMAVAAGGLVLSGDDLSTLPSDKLVMLKKLLPATGVAAEFDDQNLKVGVVRLKDRTLLCAFNWENRHVMMPVKLPKPGRVTDLWSGQDYGRRETFVGVEMAPHEGTVLVVR